MIKTNFFLGSSCSKTQAEVNSFLENEKVEYIDIKFGTALGQIICVLVYTETDLRDEYLQPELDKYKNIKVELK